jgi:SAM-dependent methyltransferase
MSTPVYWNQFLRDQPAVTRWLISDLSAKVVSKLGHDSEVDVIGDFCADPLPLPERSLDTILCISILEHCKRPGAMVENLGRLLRPGGVVFFQAPFAYIDGHLDPDYWRFCRQGYLLMAEEAGLEVVDAGELGELGRYYMLDHDESIQSCRAHHGVPVINWMICRRP